MSAVLEAAHYSNKEPGLNTDLRACLPACRFDTSAEHSSCGSTTLTAANYSLLADLPEGQLDSDLFSDELLLDGANCDLDQLVNETAEIPLAASRLHFSETLPESVTGSKAGTSPEGVPCAHQNALLAMTGKGQSAQGEGWVAWRR